MIKKKVAVKKMTNKKVTKKKVAGRTWKVGNKVMTKDQVKIFVCDRMSNISMGLKTLCDTIPGLPSRSNLSLWISLDGDFQDRYARAREEQAEFMAEEILEIADDGRNDFMEQDDSSAAFKINGENIQRSKLRIDTRKWLMGKLKPKKYGERLALDVTEDKLAGKSLDELKAMAAEYATRQV